MSDIATRQNTARTRQDTTTRQNAATIRLATKAIP